MYSRSSNAHLSPARFASCHTVWYIKRRNKCWFSGQLRDTVRGTWDVAGRQDGKKSAGFLLFFVFTPFWLFGAAIWVTSFSGEPKINGKVQKSIPSTKGGTCPLGVRRRSIILHPVWDIYYYSQMVGADARASGHCRALDADETLSIVGGWGGPAL